MSRTQRKAMIERGHSLAVTHQCELLALSRSSVYHQPAPVSEQDLEAMRLLDEGPSSVPVLREPSIERLARGAWGEGQPQAGAASDAPDGA